MSQDAGSAVGHYVVAQKSCFRCGACSSLAPEVFAMGEGGARVARQPASAGERQRSEAARINCPGQAIHCVPGAAAGAGIAGGGGGSAVIAGSSAGSAAIAEAGGGSAGIAEHVGGAAAPGGPFGIDGGGGEGPLFPRLVDEAERVRWRLVDIPWESIEAGAVTPAFVRFVREVALSELTTFSATKRFLTEMADDVDFTQWVSVWFYEETKHPEALLRWLGHFGVTVDARTVLRGRVTAPFMRSRTGTLVMNILSELFASAGYQDLTRYSKEPVLAQITRSLAGDEARHGASFYAFAERAIARAKSPEVERLQALKVLYYWVQAAGHVEHPVHQFHEKVSADPELLGVLRSIGTDYRPALERACRLIGTLIGRPLTKVEEVLPLLREMSANQGVAAPGEGGQAG